MKTLASISMFLFGTTFLWLTASFAGKTPPPTGATWTLVNVMGLAAVAAFTVGAWGLYQGHAWWQPVSVAAATIGLLALVPFLVGLRQVDASLWDLGVQINLWMHVLGTVAVILIVRVPTVNEWFTARLT